MVGSWLFRLSVNSRGAAAWVLLLLLITNCRFSLAQSKARYLAAHRFDLQSAGFTFPQKDFKIIGFGAYHGSSGTELAEQQLLYALTRDKQIKYYLPETDFSIAHFFNMYLESGDTLLLRNLVQEYGTRVPQEKSVEVYEKWKKIKSLNDHLAAEDQLVVLGLDMIVNYKYTAKQLLEVANFPRGLSGATDSLTGMVKVDTTDYAIKTNSYAAKVMKSLVAAYDHDPALFTRYITDTFVFDHLMTNIRWTVAGREAPGRDEVMFNNYLALCKYLPIQHKGQFVRMGFFHLEKSAEGGSASFFSRLITSEVYHRDQVISVIGYLTKSRVLWEIKLDSLHKYKGYSTEGGFGIGDYWKEHFKGIGKLKQQAISNFTLFQLNAEASPYRKTGTDLMEIKLFMKKSNKAGLINKATTDYLDYALLISNSAASKPLEELKW